jgi:hypothetical protein
LAKPKKVDLTSSAGKDEDIVFVSVKKSQKPEVAGYQEIVSKQVPIKNKGGSRNTVNEQARKLAFDS